MSTTSSLAYKDLRGYIDAIEEIGELRLVKGADWDLELGAITEVAARATNPKVLLFDDIKGYPSGFRVLTNPVCSAATTALAFGLDPKLTGLEIIRAWKEKLGSQKPLKPVAVSNGPITENLDSGNQVDLLKFPTPRWHEADGGRYIGTGCMVIMQDPEENWTNVGTYRVCVHDHNTLGIWISPGKHGRLIREKYWSQGRACPVVISFGQDPVLAKVASWYEPWGVSELEIAGWLFGEPVKFVRGAETGLPIPASSELAVEGYIVPPKEDSRAEGPFGEWTGYYASGTRNEPVVKVKNVFYRNNPITAINIINEAWSTPLDPRIAPDARAARNFTNSVAIVNACRPYHWKDQYAKTCYFPEETRRQTLEKWKDVLRLE